MSHKASVYTHVHDQPFTTNQGIPVESFPLDGEHEYLGWAFVYDKSLGQVSNACLDFHSMYVNEYDDE